MLVVHRPGWTLGVASVAAFMTSLDTMVVTTALPKMRADLTGSVGQLEWTMNAYYLAFACLLITAAGLGDRFGRRRVLTMGLVVFGLGSVAAAIAPGLGALVAARALQGAGAAAVLPLTLTVISEAFPPEARGKAIGIWGGLLGAGGVLGPLAGGGLVDLVGWRGIFWVNVPVTVAVVGVTCVVVSETHGPRQRLDIPGLLLVSSGSFAMAWGLVRSADDGWGHLAVVLPLFLGAALLGAFVVVEHRALAPMVPTSLFRSRSFSAANVVSLCIYASLSGGVFLMSQFFQLAQHAGPFEAALRFVPWPAPGLVLAPIVGAASTRYGNRVFLVMGMALQTVGMAWFALVADATTPYGELCVPLVVSGIGISCVFPSVSSEVMSSVPPDRMGVAAGVNGSIRELGGVLGVALAATVFANAGGYSTVHTFTHGFTAAMWLCTGLSSIAIIAALAVEPHKLADLSTPITRGTSVPA